MPCIFIAIALNLKIILKSINNINSSNLWTEGIFPFVCVWVCAFPVCWSLTFWVKFTLKCYFLNFSLLLKDTKVRHGHMHTHTHLQTHTCLLAHTLQTHEYTCTHTHMHAYTRACLHDWFCTREITWHFLPCCSTLPLSPHHPWRRQPLSDLVVCWGVSS